MGTARRSVGTLAILALGYACGRGGGGDMLVAALTQFEFGGGSLTRQLAEAGAPAITPPFGIAERVPGDGTRHFTLTVATENYEAANDAVALYSLMDAHAASGNAWGANILGFAHSDMRGGSVTGLEIDVGNLGTPVPVPVTGLNLFAIGAAPADVAIGVLNGVAPDGGGFREGIAFRSTPPGVAVTEALLRVHPGFGTVATGIDLREAIFAGPALATPGFTVDGTGAITSAPLALGAPAYACVDAAGRFFASREPCVR